MTLRAVMAEITNVGLSLKATHMASMTLPRGQHHILPPGFGDDHLRAHLVEFHPQLPLMQVDLDAFHALQKK